MKDKNLMIKFCFIYFLAYGIIALGYTQYVPYLSSIGYNPMERGILISSYAITTIAFQLIFGILSDKYKTVKKLCIIAVLAFSIFTYLFYSLETKMFLLHMILISMSAGLANLNFGYFDNWLFTFGEKAREQFSFIRAFGSIGWAVASIFIAKLLDLFAYKGLGLIIVLLTIIMLGLMFLIAEGSKANEKKTEKITVMDIRELLSNKKYILTIVILFLVYCANNSNATTIIDKMLELGATNAEIGYKWTIPGLVEIPVYIYGSFFLRKFGPYKLLSISAFTIMLQFIFFGISNSLYSMILLSGFQIITGPMMMLASRILIFEFSSEKLKSTGLLLALSIYSGVSAFIMPSIGGTITNYFNVNTTIFIVAVTAGVGFILSLVLNCMEHRS
ncbi:putative 3-phenylpropionic acid transporter [Clostridium puniceum]|uniref:Putative 3-phenylpropionic acid transporter n=1 Tax=Clostridium puniceum TaxID=29367 RepID=A0A1S8T1R7_9CLOT|nr:MFS transporter [Clostridium puniceum]OOM71633.1 putative 3-phenylpropionic acid transporter [Clostridium puniceum]